MSLTTSHSVFQPVVASTLQGAPELWVNRLPDTESQGGCPDRGRVRAERPGGKGRTARGRVWPWYRQQEGRWAVAGEPRGVRLEQGPTQEGSGRRWPGAWTQCGEWRGQFERSKLESDVTDIFAASLWLEWVGRNKWSRAS